MVFVGIPTTGYVRKELSELLVRFSHSDRDVEVEFFSNRPVDSNRCIIVKEFLETDHEYLLMIDEDVVPPDDVLDIMDYEEEIMSPIVYSMAEGVPYPAIAEFDDNEQFKMLLNADDELTKVDGFGTGCIFIHRRVFEDIDEPYFRFKKNNDGTVNTGEDYDFCVRAGEAGFDLYLASDYSCKHYSEVDLEAVMKLMNIALKAGAQNHRMVNEFGVEDEIYRPKEVRDE